MIKPALISIALSTLLLGSTTMCFKKDHLDPSSIESIALDGGECQGKFSVNDMKTQGYDVKDIKITLGDKGMNYIYIFSKETIVLGEQKQADGQALTKEQLKAYLYEINEEEKQKEEQEELHGSVTKGKEIYESKCMQCHGNGKKKYGRARALSTLSVGEIKDRIRDYEYDKIESITAIVMKPYAVSLTPEKLKNVASYIQTLK